MEVIRLIELKKQDKGILNSLIKLHLNTLPNSLSSSFGFLFLKLIYFNKFVKYGFIDGILILDEGKCIAYSIITDKGLYYLKLGILKFFLLFNYCIFLSTIFKPIIIKKIFVQYFNLRKSFKKKTIGNNIWLTMAIDPEYINKRDELGVRTSIKVVDETINLWNVLSIRKIYGKVRKDNKAAILLYKSFDFNVIINHDEKDIYYDVIINV